MKYLILTIITLSLLSCHSRKTAKNADTETENTLLPKEIVVDANFQQPKDNSSFEITAASIENDILTITVTYSGGCKDHEFNAYFNEIYMKSQPPKAGIFIHHIGNDDLCKKLVTEELKFNLKPMRYPGKDSGYKVMIGMNNYKGYIEYDY
ncbi:MAG: hypothetical protein H6599_11020 [Flavobacteriales bacterium]|nr:hypothetical protein [Flavobacteriales bacterium]